MDSEEFLKQVRKNKNSSVQEKSLFSTGSLSLKSETEAESDKTNPYSDALFNSESLKRPTLNTTFSEKCESHAQDLNPVNTDSNEKAAIVPEHIRLSVNSLNSTRSLHKEVVESAYAALQKAPVAPGHIQVSIIPPSTPEESPLWKNIESPTRGSNGALRPFSSTVELIASAWSMSCPTASAILEMETFETETDDYKIRETVKNLQSADEMLNRENISSLSSSLTSAKSKFPSLVKRNNNSLRRSSLEELKKIESSGETRIQRKRYTVSSLRQLLSTASPHSELNRSVPNSIQGAFSHVAEEEEISAPVTPENENVHADFSKKGTNIDNIEVKINVEKNSEDEEAVRSNFEFKTAQPFRKTRANPARKNLEFSKPEKIQRPPRTIWEAILRPIKEVPSAGWDLQFKPSKLERAFQLYIFGNLIKHKLRKYLWGFTIWKLLTMVLDFFEPDNQNSLNKTIVSQVFELSFFLFSAIISSNPGIWKKHHKTFIKFWMVAMGTANLIKNIFDIYLPATSNSHVIAYNVVGFTAVVTLLFPISFLRIICINLGYTTITVLLETILLIPRGVHPVRVLANLLVYLTSNIVGAYFAYVSEIYQRRSFMKVRITFANQEKLAVAREHSENLLQMILPKKVIETLRKMDLNDAKRSINDTFMELRGVTIMFADIVGFTEFSSSVKADYLVAILSQIFSEFDAIATDFDLEKIKTIGDCIQIAGGVPDQLECEEKVVLYAEKVCLMGLCILKAIEKISNTINQKLSLRIGVHTGSLIAGVIGLWKFKYDIWSQDVDLASMMEQSGKPGIIHVSSIIHGLLRDYPLFRFTPSTPVKAFDTTIPTFDLVPIDTLTETKLNEIRCIHRDSVQSKIGEGKIETRVQVGVNEKEKKSKSNCRVKSQMQTVTSLGFIDNFGTVTSNGRQHRGNTVRTEKEETPGETSQSQQKISKDEKIESSLGVSNSQNLHSHSREKISSKSSKSARVQSHHAKLVAYQKKFKCETNSWTLEFNDKSKEEQYRQDFIRHYTGTITVTASIVLFVYWVYFGIYIMIWAVFKQSAADGQWRESYRLAIYGVLGFFLTAFVYFFYQMNYRFRVRYFNVVDKGENAATSLWLAGSGESFDSDQGSVGKTQIGSLNAISPKKHSYRNDKLSWFMPNGFAYILVTVYFIGTLLGITPAITFFVSKSYNAKIVITSGLPLEYTTAALVVSMQLLTLFIGTRVHRLNIGLIITLIILLIVHVFISLTPVTNSSTLQKRTLSLSWTKETSIFVERILNFVCWYTVSFAMNRTMDSLARLSFFMKRENEISYAQTKITQYGGEKLLRNILPLSVVQRMRETQKHIADDREDVSIMFCSISNFLPFESSSQKATIALLNEIICDIDECCVAFGVEKIKTIGTKYMAYAEDNPDFEDYHLTRLVDFAIELNFVIQELNMRNNHSFILKTGIHVGPAVTGVIGTRTFTFDVWGDTVNVASRMESTGLDGEIQVTDSVFLKLYNDYTFTPRGQVYVKGKGNMHTYFIKGRKVLSPSLENVSSFDLDQVPKGAGSVVNFHPSRSNVGAQLGSEFLKDGQRGVSRANKSSGCLDTQVSMDRRGSFGMNSFSSKTVGNKRRFSFGKWNSAIETRDSGENGESCQVNRI
ncbi:Adenylate cyclase type 1 [Nowakowskiella sp. JEL0407]|nr:Adenylate cyclase type 1 [Nowakowskiella sp. JEL0407]